MSVKSRHTHIKVGRKSEDVARVAHNSFNDRRNRKSDGPRRVALELDHVVRTKIVHLKDVNKISSNIEIYDD